MSNLDENATIELPCPECGHKTPKTIGWIKAKNEYTCVCGKSIVIERDNFLAGLGEVDKSVGDLKKKFKWIS